MALAGAGAELQVEVIDETRHSCNSCTCMQGAESARVRVWWIGDGVKNYSAFSIYDMQCTGRRRQEIAVLSRVRGGGGGERE
jgi:hypothetical protein